MLTVDKFLCFKLETGGKFVGWLGVIASAIVAPILIFEVIYLPSISCKEFMEMIEKFFKEYTDELELYECNDIKGVLTKLFQISILLYLCVFIICFLLLRGISKKSHKKVLPMVVFEAVEFIMHAIFLLYVLVTKGPLNILFYFEIFACILAFYFFTVLYSLYLKYKNGNGGNVVNVQFDKSQNV